MTSYLSDGASFYIGTSVASLVQVGQVHKIAPSGFQLGIENFTSNASVDGWVEVYPTRLSAGSIDLDIYYDPANSTHANLLTYITSKTQVTCRIVFPTSPAKTWTFVGYISEFKPSIARAEAINLVLKIVLSGKPTFA